MQTMRHIRGFDQAREALSAWASDLHSKNGQTWANGQPYRAHLESVENVLLRFGFSDPEDATHQVLRLAAWAHDLVEDTDVDRITLRILQGPDVERLVWSVTEEPGVNREERHGKTYQKIMASAPWAIVLKLADRISNVEASLAHGPERLLKMYRNEHGGFRAALYRTDDITADMWTHLDGLISRGQCQNPRSVTPTIRMVKPDSRYTTP